VEILQRPACQAEIAPADAMLLNTHITDRDEPKSADRHDTTITGVLRPDSRFVDQLLVTAIAIILEAPHRVRYQSEHSSHALEH